MRIYKVGLPFIGMSSLMLLMSPLANAAEMPSIDHSGMDMSGMDHSSMDMSGMDHSSMNMSGMQGGEPPADARSPDYSNGVP